VISRVGLVATIISGVVFSFLENNLLTLNFSAWYANSTLLTLLLILLLLGYGCKVSLANQSLFGDKLMKDL
jgi:hypothetical protein